MENNQLKRHIEEYENNWIDIRRHLHAHPELSFQEEKTAAFIVEYLRKLKLKDIKTGIAGHGISVDIQCKNKDAEWVLLRADMDALPIEEKNKVAYQSQNKGVMHACGHDVHSTVMLGVVETITKYSKNLRYNVRVIFQPGEELLPGGASLMIKEGVLDDHDFKKAIALHVYPELPAGKIGLKKGLYMASCDEIYINIEGKGGHGAMPQKLVDPVLLGSQIVTSLQQVISRKCPPEIPSVLSIGKFIADGATNVIPSKVYMEGTFRTYDENWRSDAHQFIKKHIKNLSHSVGAKVNVEIKKGYPFLKNNPVVTEELSTFASQLLGKENVTELGLRPTGEDFAYFTQKLPCCFFRLGTGDVNKKENHGVHHPEFDIDEKAIGVGVYFLSAYLLQ